jgi:hypothetical protein
LGIETPVEGSIDIVRVAFIGVTTRKFGSNDGCLTEDWLLEESRKFKPRAALITSGSLPIDLDVGTVLRLDIILEK